MEEGGLILGTHHTIPLSICGDLSKVPQTNICLLDRPYQYNNQKRQCMDLPALNIMIVLASL